MAKLKKAAYVAETDGDDDMTIWTTFLEEMAGGGVHLQAGLFKPSAARKMAMNEWGAEGIPARPLMGRTADFVDDNAYLDDLVHKLVADVSKGGGVAAVEAAFEDVGEDMSMAFMRLISNKTTFRKNAMYTISEKGFDHPLVETGELAGSFETRVKRYKTKQKKKKPAPAPEPGLPAKERRAAKGAQGPKPQRVAAARRETAPRADRAVSKPQGGASSAKQMRQAMRSLKAVVRATSRPSAMLAPTKSTSKKATMTHFKPKARVIRAQTFSRR